jgi:hypothetical protein
LPDCRHSTALSWIDKGLENQLVFELYPELGSLGRC